MNLKNGKVFTSKFVGTGPSSYKKRIYRTAVSQRLRRNTDLEDQRDAVVSSLYLFYCQVTLHVSGVSHTHHQEYTNCSYNTWYKSCCKLQVYHLDENCGLENWFKLLTCNLIKLQKHKLMMHGNINVKLHLVSYGTTKYLVFFLRRNAV